MAAVVAKGLFWGSLGAICWTHAGYPLLAAVLARLRPQPVARADATPSVEVIVAAHDEEAVIGQRLENLLGLDYPPDRLGVMVASDQSADATDAIVKEVASRDERVRLLRVPRGGKVAAQDRAVAATRAEIVAFSDANTLWSPDALRLLVRSFADPAVAYVCGSHSYEGGDGTNREGVYARFEGRLRAAESQFGSVTAGVGPIYAVRRDDYVELDPRFGHDLALPYLLVRRGRRAVVDPEARAWEKPARDIEDEYRRKRRMFEHCWLIVLRGGMLRGAPPLYALQLVSHRHLRYVTGFLHLFLLLASARLAASRGPYRFALAAQVALLGVAACRSGLARYYVLVTWATVPALGGYLRRGVPPVWEQAPGSR
jgi:cellulose synthase/poly-beta-1,6-N-acetylglucosamine synthase-like glycosyltransferase